MLSAYRPEARTRRRQVVACAAALAVVMGLGRFAFTPMLPHLRIRTGLSTPAAGLAAAANHVGYLVGAFYLTLNQPRRALAWWRGALAGAVATTALAASSGAPEWLATVRFTHGLATAVVFVLAATTISKLGAGAVAFTGVGVGIVVATSAIAGAAPHTTTSGPLWLTLAALAALAAAVAWQADVTPQDASDRTPPAHSDNQPIHRIAAGYGLMGFGYIVTATFLVALVRDSRLPTSVETIAWISFGLAAIPSAALWSWLALRFDARTTLIAAHLIQAAGTFALALRPHPITAVLAAVTVGGTFIGVTTLAVTLASKRQPHQPQRAVATVTLAFATGQALGPALSAAAIAAGATLAQVTAVAAVLVAAGAATYPNVGRPASGPLGSGGLGHLRSGPQR